MKDDDKKIECGVHGKSSATFICQHLSTGEKLGFNLGFDPDQPDELYPDAWCDLCEEVLEKEDEWNDTSEAFANIKLVCAQCYCAIREKNWNQDEAALHNLISSSFKYSQEVQNRFMETYRIGKHGRWDWYQETGRLIFSEAGNPVVECDIDFVGTFSKSSNTWMWAWANSSFTESIKKQSRKIRILGEKVNLLKLASALWSADHVDGWEMTAVMAKELGAIGMYRTPDDNGFVYMIVNAARWVN